MLQLAPTPAPQEPPRAADALEVRLPGQRSIVVRPGFDRPTLRALLATLEAGAAGTVSGGGRATPGGSA
jgi:hypothetical protein